MDQPQNDAYVENEVEEKTSAAEPQASQLSDPVKPEVTSGVDTPGPQPAEPPTDEDDAPEDDE